MKKNYEYIEDEFDKYLDGGMAKQEKTAFEARLAADPALQEEFVFHHFIREGLLKSSTRARQKKEIGEIRREMLRRQWRFRFWKIVLAVILLLLLAAVGFWFFKPAFFPSPSQANKQYRETPQEPLPGQNGQDRTLDELAEQLQKEEEPIAQQKPTAPEANATPINDAPLATDEILSGKKNAENSLSGSIQPKKLIAANGNTAPVSGEESALILVQSIFDQELQGQLPKYRFLKNELKIYTARPNDFSPNQLEMVELEQPGSLSRFFLKSGGNWYRVTNDGKRGDLHPVNDKDILRLLE